MIRSRLKDQIDKSRGLGKTYDMIKSLPSDKNILIFVHAYSYVRTLKEKIRSLRPEIDIEKITFMPLSEEGFNGLRGYKFSQDCIFIDNGAVDNFVLREIPRFIFNTGVVDVNRSNNLKRIY